MSKFLLCIGLCLGLLASGFSQAPDARSQRSGEILDKIRQIDMLNHILPVLMTKEQIRKLLPAIEKARAKVRDIQRLEAEDLTKFESKIDGVLARGFEKGEVPTRDVLNELHKLMAAFSLRRQIAAGENMEVVMPVVEATLDAGQKKAAGNSLHASIVAPDTKPEELTDEQKLRFYVQHILLDPAAYDVLVRLSK
jgi:hypothetical protein